MQMGGMQRPQPMGGGMMGGPRPAGMPPVNGGIVPPHMQQGPMQQNPMREISLAPGGMMRRPM